MTLVANARAARRTTLLGAAFPPYSRVLLKVVAAASLAGLTPALAGQLPTGGSVASGSATIGAPSKGSLTITQTSDQAIINWTGFSIGQKNSVTFDNGSGATLNRVTGGTSSSIDGSLTATGSVYLLNPNGVVIGPGGTVNVGKNFVASTLGTTDGAFNAGGSLTLSGNSSAIVANLGKISSLGGDVALVARNVANAGAISAPNGAAGVLAGTQVTLRDATLNDGKFSVDLGTSSDNALNVGNVAAAEAELKANGGNVYALAGNTSGDIAATGVSSNDGKVFLTAGDTGSVTTNATITAQNSSSAGGTVETSGGTVNFDGSHVTARDWLIKSPNLTVNSPDAATISANLATTNVTLQATQNPGPGDIVVNSSIGWSTNHNLTLSAYRDVDVNANIASAGGANVTLRADNSATSTGTVNFGNGDQVSTSGHIDIFYNPVNYDTPTNFSGDVAGGTTLHAYMLVNTVSQLQAIGADATTLAGTYALGTDIDASATSGWNSGAGFIPIGGNASPDFTGTFNGDGHTITQLFINYQTPFVRLDDTGILPLAGDVGLFGAVGASGLVENVNLAGASIKAGDAMTVATLVGGNYGTVNNVTAQGSVIAGNGTPLEVAVGGGLIGVEELGGNVANSSASVNVMGGAASEVGGLVGVMVFGGSINNSSASGNVSASGVVASARAYGGPIAGGLVGAITGVVGLGPTPVVENSSASGAVQTSGNFPQQIYGLGGGLIGDITGPATITNDAATGAVIGGLADVDGGFVGVIGIGSGQAATITNGTASGNVSVAIGDAGGFSGQQKFGSISSSTASGAVSLQFGGNAGGFNGEMDGGSVANSTASGAVSGVGTNGGFTGVLANGGSVTNSTASGNVSGTGTIGGFVGMLNGGLTNDSASGNVSGSGGDGGLVGENSQTGTIISSHASGNVQSTHGSVGGLVGHNDGSISASYATGLATDTSTINTGIGTGGLVGINSAVGHITNSYALGNVSGDDTVGGLVGYNFGFISGSYATGNVSAAANSVGGLVGDNTNFGTIDLSYATGNVHGADLYVGGLVGNSAGSVTNSYATGGATGVADVGGFVGRNFGTISNSFATGAVSASIYGGGFVGELDSGEIDRSYATGAVVVLGDTPAGGFAALVDSSATINDAYATGTVSGGTNSGGFAGIIATGAVVTNAYESGLTNGGLSSGAFVGGLQGTVNNTYYNATANGSLSGIGGNAGTGTAVGLTATQMLDGSNFAGFDFTTIWTITPGQTPTLQHSP